MFISCTLSAIKDGKKSVAESSNETVNPIALKRGPSECNRVKVSQYIEFVRHIE